MFPKELSDEIAVLAEPIACALHGVLKSDLDERDEILIIGAGTMGLLTVAVIRALEKTNRVPYCRQIPASTETGARTWRRRGYFHTISIYTPIFAA